MTPSVAVQAAFLVGSNLAFVWPAVIALRDRMYYEGVVFFLMGLVSGLYHVPDTIPDTHFLLDTRVWRYLDFFLAFALITRATLMVLFSTGFESTSEQVYRNLHVKMCSHVVLDTLALALVLQDVATELFVMILTVICLLFVVAVYWYDHQALDLDVKDLLVGWAFITLGAIMYFMCGSGGCYWWAHSFWHMAVAVGLALLVESRNHGWNLLNVLCCGRYCSPNRKLAARNTGTHTPANSVC